MSRICFLLRSATMLFARDVHEFADRYSALRIKNIVVKERRETKHRRKEAAVECLGSTARPHDISSWISVTFPFAAALRHSQTVECETAASARIENNKSETFLSKWLSAAYRDERNCFITPDDGRIMNAFEWFCCVRAQKSSAKELCGSRKSAQEVFWTSLLNPRR